MTLLKDFYKRVRLNKAVNITAGLQPQLSGGTRTKTDQKTAQNSPQLLMIDREADRKRIKPSVSIFQDRRRNTRWRYSDQ